MDFDNGHVTAQLNSPLKPRDTSWLIILPPLNMLTW